MIVCAVILSLLLASPCVAEDIDAYLRAHPDVILDIIKEHPVTLLKTVQEGSEKSRTRQTLLSFLKQKENGTKPEVKTAGRLILGNPKATTTLLMYTDFTCHFCAKTMHSMARLLPELHDRVQLVIKAAPRGGGIGLTAFKMLYAASEKDAAKAFSFALELFTEQDRLLRDGEELLKKIADRVGLAGETLLERSSDDKYEQLLQEDIAECHKYHIDATPTLYFNAIRVNGFLPDALYRAAVDVAEGKNVTLPNTQ